MAINAVILDSGALSALALKDEAIRSALDKALRDGANIFVPTVVIAESTTGTSRDAPVNRVLKTTLKLDCDTETARAAAVLRYSVRSGEAGTIDAIVVASADRYGDSIVLTSDMGDLTPLASVLGRTRVVELSTLLRAAPKPKRRRGTK